MKKFLLASILAFSAYGQAVVFDCNSDCRAESQFTYNCPTWRNPRRLCTATNGVKKALCETDKAASCKLWNEAVDFFTPHVKPVIQGEFNAQKYQEAEASGQAGQYMGLCSAAAMATCVAIGAKIGGQFGAVVGGAGGVFISYQICRQSTTW